MNFCIVNFNRSKSSLEVGREESDGNFKQGSFIIQPEIEGEIGL